MKKRGSLCRLIVSCGGRNNSQTWCDLKTLVFLSIWIVFFPGISRPAEYVPSVYNSTQGIKLVLQNDAVSERTYDPVTSGVPLAEAMGVTDPKDLVLANSNGVTVPAQYKVLARWGDLKDSTKPIKWVLVDFQANVPANGIATYYLKSRPGNIPPVWGGILVSETENAINLNTGAMTFEVLKTGPNLFSEVRLARDTTAIVKPDTASGIFIERNGKVYRAVPDSVSIAEKGFLRTVILITGKFKTETGETFVGGDARMYTPGAGITPASQNLALSYTMRIHAYKGKSHLKIVYTLENNGNTVSYYYPTNDVFIDSNYFQISPLLGVVTTATCDATSTTLTGCDAFSLYQRHDVINKSNESKNFSYGVVKNGNTVYAGSRSPGWVDFSDRARGLSVGMRHFWQNYPKSISYSEKSIRLGIFPDPPIARETTGPFTKYSTGNYYFSGGWHKTTEIFLYFHKSNAVNAATASVLGQINAPLFAKCDPDWYCGSLSWGPVAPSRANCSSDALMQNSFDRYEDYQQMFVDRQKDALGRDIFYLRESRNLGRDHYGWENFGDMTWLWSLFPSLHYDWPFIMWLQFLRSGDSRHMDLAKEMTEHSIDLDQIHGSSYNGIWQWEDTGGSHVNYHHKSTQGAGAIISHTWNGGYTLGYFLTGDARYLAAVRRSAGAGRKFWSSEPWTNAIGGKKVIWDQTRSQGWSILMLLNEYKVTGDRKNLAQSLAIFRNSLLYTEKLPYKPGSNGGGYITVDRYAPDPSLEGKAVVTFLTYPLEPLCELHRECSRAGLEVSDLEAYIIRSLSWLKDFAYVGGKLNEKGTYSLLTVSYATDPLNPANNLGGELAHNIHVAGAFGYGSKLLRDKNPEMADQYLSFARNLFKDLMLYREAPKRTIADFIDPNIYSPISWGWLPTATKELGYIGRGGQYYLRAEYEPSTKP